MPRQRGSRGKGGDKANGGGKRAAPYEARQGNRKGGNQPAKGGSQPAKGGARDGRGPKGSKSGGGGGGGGGRGGRGGRGRGGDKPKPKTAEELDREMDSYWGKSEEHAQKKLDSDMDDYWKNKDATKADGEEATAVVEDKVGEPAAAAPAADAPAESAE